MKKVTGFSCDLNSQSYLFAGKHSWLLFRVFKPFFTGGIISSLSNKHLSAKTLLGGEFNMVIILTINTHKYTKIFLYCSGLTLNLKKNK